MKKKKEGNVKNVSQTLTKKKKIKTHTSIHRIHQLHEYPPPNVYTPATALLLPKDEDHQEYIQ